MVDSNDDMPPDRGDGGAETFVREFKSRSPSSSGAERGDPELEGLSRSFPTAASAAGRMSFTCNTSQPARKKDEAKGFVKFLTVVT